MEKKYFNTPSLKVIEVKDDIIATSTVNARMGANVDSESGILVGGRRDMFDDSYDEF